MCYIVSSRFFDEKLNFISTVAEAGAEPDIIEN